MPYHAIFSPESAYSASLSRPVCPAWARRQSKKPRRSFCLQPENEASRASVISTVALSPDGKLLAAAGDDHIIRIWTIDGLKLIHEMHGHTDWIRSVAFSPDGLTGYGRQEQIATVRLWDVATGTPSRVLAENELSIYAVRFSPDGNSLAAAGFEEKLQVYEVATGKTIHTLDTACRDMRALAFSPDGTLLAAGCGGGKIIMEHDRRQGQLEQTAPCRWIASQAFSPERQPVGFGEQGYVHQDVGRPRRKADFCRWKVTVAKVRSLTFCGAKMLASGAGDNADLSLGHAGRNKKSSALVGHTGTVSSLVRRPAESPARLGQLRHDHSVLEPGAGPGQDTARVHSGIWHAVPSRGSRIVCTWLPARCVAAHADLEHTQSCAMPRVILPSTGTRTVPTTFWQIRHRRT